MYNGWLVIWPYFCKITEISYDISTYDYKIPSIHEVFLFSCQIFLTKKFASWFWIFAPIHTKITPFWCWLSRPKIQWNVVAVRKIWQHLFSSCSLRIKIMDIITRLDFSCHFFAQQETFFSTMVVVVFLMTKEKSCRKLTFLASDEKSNKTVRWRRKGLFRPIARFFYQMLSRLNQWKWQGDGSPLFCPRRIITFLALKHKNVRNGDTSNLCALVSSI